MRYLLPTAVASFVVLLLVALYFRDAAEVAHDPVTLDVSANSPQDEPLVAKTNAPNRVAGTSALAIVNQPWESLDVASVPLAFQRSEIANIAYLSLVDISLPRVGDNLNFNIPQENQSYTGKVTNVSISPGGNRSIAGSLEVEGSKSRLPSIYKFVLTSSETQVFATLNTPQGQYQMEARDGIGRLIPTASIRSKLDYNKPDYVTPDNDVAPKATKQG